MLANQTDSRALALSLLSTLRAYQKNEQTKVFVAMLDAMQENYVARLLDGPIEDVPALRTASKQLQLLRDALSFDDMTRISLLL